MPSSMRLDLSVPASALECASEGSALPKARPDCLGQRWFSIAGRQSESPKRTRADGSVRLHPLNLTDYKTAKFIKWDKRNVFNGFIIRLCIEVGECAERRPMMRAPNRCLLFRRSGDHIMSGRVKGPQDA